MMLPDMVGVPEIAAAAIGHGYFTAGEIALESEDERVIPTAAAATTFDAGCARKWHVDVEGAGRAMRLARDDRDEIEGYGCGKETIVIDYRPNLMVGRIDSVIAEMKIGRRVVSTIEEGRRRPAVVSECRTDPFGSMRDW